VAIKLLNRLDSAGLQPNAYAYAAVINGCLNTQPARGALVVDLLQRMVDAGITPTNTTYNRAIATCVNSDPPMVDEAIALLAAAPTPLPADKRKTLTVRKAYSKIILALGKARPPRIDDALGLFAQMDTNGIGADGFTHSTMVSACAAVHPATPEALATALDVVDKMTALGHPIDQYTISALMRCCVGIPGQATGLFRKFVAGGDVVVNRHVRRNLRKAITDDAEYNELVQWAETVAPATSLDVDRVRPNGTVKLAQTDAEREARGKGRERTRKRPDWDCGSCTARNFGFRTRYRTNDTAALVMFLLRLLLCHGDQQEPQAPLCKLTDLRCFIPRHRPHPHPQLLQV